MAKSIVSCGGKTINLARQGCSLNDRKTKLFLIETNKLNRKPPFEDPQPRTQLPIGLTKCNRGKSLRVCTAADLKKTCPPVMCDCPPKSGPSVLGKIFGFGIKSLIAAGLVYWTYHIGLWGDASQTEKLYLDIKDFISEQTKPKDVSGAVGDSIDSSNMDGKIYPGIDTWNSLVSTTFGYVSRAMDSFTNMIDGQKKEPVPAPEDEPAEK